MLGAIGHGDALGETEQAVDGDRVSKHGPTRGRVFGAAADEKRTRCHEGVEFVEIVALRDEFRVGTGAWGGRGNEATRACRGGVEAEIPRLLIVDARARFVEDDAGIGPDGAGEFVVKASGKQRPLAAVGMADETDARGINLGQASEGGMGVGGDVGEK